MEKKYELTDKTIEYCGRTLHRIKALKDFSDVEAGELGGYIEKEENLDHEGDCWVYGNAIVCGNAKVYEDAEIHDDAVIFNSAEVFGNSSVYGRPQISGNARIFGCAFIDDDAIICGDSWVYDNARVYDNAKVYCDSKVYGSAEVFEMAIIRGGLIHGSAKVRGDAIIHQNAHISNITEIDRGDIYGDAKIEKESDYLYIKGLGSKYRATTAYRNQSDGITVICGCFGNSLDKFEKRVKETHGDSKYAQEYLTLIQLIKIHFGIPIQNTLV